MGRPSQVNTSGCVASIDAVSGRHTEFLTLPRALASEFRPNRDDAWTAKKLPFGSRFQQPWEKQTSLLRLLRNIDEGKARRGFASDRKTLASKHPTFWTLYTVS